MKPPECWHVLRTIDNFLKSDLTFPVSVRVKLIAPDALFELGEILAAERGTEKKNEANFDEQEAEKDEDAAIRSLSSGMNACILQSVSARLQS